MRDQDHELLRLGVRDYQPSTGRWTAKDPILFWGGLNLYAYVANDPQNRLDRVGLQEDCPAISLSEFIEEQGERVRWGMSSEEFVNWSTSIYELGMMQDELILTLTTPDHAGGVDPSYMQGLWKEHIEIMGPSMLLENNRIEGSEYFESLPLETQWSLIERFNWHETKGLRRVDTQQQAAQTSFY